MSGFFEVQNDYQLSHGDKLMIDYLVESYILGFVA